MDSQYNMKWKSISKDMKFCKVFVIVVSPSILKHAPERRKPPIESDTVLQDNFILSNFGYIWIYIYGTFSKQITLNESKNSLSIANWNIKFIVIPLSFSSFYIECKKQENQKDAIYKKKNMRSRKTKDSHRDI